MPSPDPRDRTEGVPRPASQASLISLTSSVTGTDALLGLALGTYKVEARSKESCGQAWIKSARVVTVERRASQEGMGSGGGLGAVPNQPEKANRVYLFLISSSAMPCW